MSYLSIYKKRERLIENKSLKSIFYIISFFKLKTVHLCIERISQTLPKSLAKSRLPYGTYDYPLNAASVRT